ncbi:MAG: cytochrome c3 family protein [Armatimonadota bacterium]
MRTSEASLATLLAIVVALLAVSAAAAQEATYVGNKLCVMCHAKQKKTWETTAHAKAKPPDATPESKWRYTTGSEDGVNCEACHGPGSAHQAAPLKEKKQVVGVKPQELGRAQQFALCARCHSQGTMPNGAKFPEGYKPGGTLPAEYKLTPEPKNTRLKQWNEMQGSKHITDEKGATCITCHTAHADIEAKPQLRKPINELCGGCHPDQADIAKHSKGKAKKGDTCATCHMPDHSHNFAKPVPE